MTDSGKKGIVVVSLVIVSVLTVLNLLIIILAGGVINRTGMIPGLAWLIFCVVLLVKERCPRSVVSRLFFIIASFAVLTAAVFYLAIPSPCSTTSVSRYRIQRAYERLFNYTIDTFPDELPENISNYSFSSFSGFMMGGPSADLSFCTDTHQAAQIASEAQKDAICSFDLKRYCKDSRNEEITGFLAAMEAERETLFFNADEILSESGTIYLTGFDNSTGSLKYSYVIIGSDGQSVQYGERGKIKKM